MITGVSNDTGGSWLGNCLQKCWARACWSTSPSGWPPCRSALVRQATSRAANATAAGVVVGFALTIVHLIGIPLTGTSVNPARSLGPALIVGGTALSQVWLFIVAPLIGGALAAGLHRLLYPEMDETLASGDLSTATAD
jgi:glycerol uptake facilitator-like aquaporin